VDTTRAHKDALRAGVDVEEELEEEVVVSDTRLITIAKGG
jgi:hypothetical protein